MKKQKISKTQPLPSRNRRLFFETLLFLFVFLLPTQFGKHFFLPFSYLSGIRIDYLAPTVYITDVLAGALILFHIKHIVLFLQKRRAVTFFFLTIALHTLFAFSREIALYRYLKVFELFALFVVFRSIAFDRKILLYGLLGGAIFQTGLGVAQLAAKQSLQGFFYFFGERYLSLSLPGVAKASIEGVEFLRPYATFSHPNSLAGFYLLLYAFFLVSKGFERYPLARKALLVFCSFLIILSFSKAALFGYLLVNVIYFIWKKPIDFSCIPCSLSKIFFLIFFSLLILTVRTDPLSLQKRITLAGSSLHILGNHFFLGVGLGNYLIAAHNAGRAFIGFTAQPVHNVFLLLVSETGIFVGGFLFFLLFRYTSSRIKNLSFVLCCIVIVVTGLADHYWITLQQNWLLMGVIFGLSERS